MEREAAALARLYGSGNLAPSEAVRLQCFDSSIND
jgi:hypothetical protein